MYLEAQVEDHLYRSGSPTMVGGMATFLKDPASPPEIAAPGLLHKLNEGTPLEMARDTAQVADVFLYLCDKDGTRLAFARFEASRLIPVGAAFAPRWVLLHPMQPQPMHLKQYPPSVLVSVALFAESEAYVPWPPSPLHFPPRTELRPYEVRCHLFQGRGLPALDDDGAVDAYVRGRFAGSHLRSTSKDKPGPDGRHLPRTKVQQDTLHPTFLETLATQAWLPAPLASLVPQLALTVWDCDGTPGNGDDFVGQMRLDLRNVGVHRMASPWEPQWLPLCDRYGDAEGCGELLLQLELVPLDEPSGARDVGARPLLGAPKLAPSDKPTRELKPPSKPHTLSAYIIGVRGLRAASSSEAARKIFEPKSPFVSIDDGTGAKKATGVKGEELTTAQKRKLGNTKTATSSKPSAINPSFMEQLKLQMELPTDSTFLPMVHLRVKDSLYGGLRTPLLGIGTYDITPRLQNLLVSSQAPGAEEEAPSDAMEFETWENQRLVPGVGWGPRLPVPFDPPRYSSKEAPYVPRSKASFQLPSHAWTWSGGWAVDKTLHPTDPDGWGYAHSWAASHVVGLQPEHPYDLVRRRRWVRKCQLHPETDEQVEEGDGEEGEDDEYPDDGRDPCEQLIDRLNEVEAEERKLKSRVEMFKGSRNKEGDLEESKAALERVKDKKKKLEAKFEIASRQPAYLKGRAEVKEELENTLVGIPFDVVPVYSGQGRKRIMTGRIKALFSLTARGAPPSTEDAALLEAMTPQDHVVRLYVLRGKSLMPMDAGGYSDPYLRVSLGRRTISHRSQHLKDVSNANFYDYFEFKTSLPGESTLTIECFDWDEFSRDDLIGVTEIDLEDRVCCPLWQQEMSSRPPVEWRSLYSTHSRNEQGQLELWCDILPAAVADELPPFDIKPPPPQKWELRVICWKAKEVISDDYSGLSDLYCEFRFAGGKPTATDTHFRAKNGKASWNWRIKFPVELDAFSKDKRLTVQLWDRDIGSNDYYGSASISLDKWLRRIFRRRLEVHQYWMPEDPLKSEREEQELAGITGQAFENLTELAETVLDKESAPLIGSTPDEELLDTRFWCPMHNADGVVKGQVLLSIEAVPAQEMDSRKAGHGRKEPNENPQLPKPVGRLKFTLNPCVMVYSLLGPRLCRQLSCVLCILLLILLLYYMIPVVFGEGLYNIIADLFDDIF